MNPKATAQDTETSASKSMPFAQISEVEEREEARERATLTALDEEFHEEEKSIKNTTQSEEARFRDEARKELQEFAESEPAAILAQSQEETEATLNAIESSFKKRVPAVSKKLVSAILHFSFLPHQ